MRNKLKYFDKQNEMPEQDIINYFSSFPERHLIERNSLQKYRSYIDMVGDLKLLKTKAEVRRTIESGGAYLNGKRITASEAEDLSCILKSYLLADRYLVARFGKKSYFLIEFKWIDHLKKC